jgi:CRP/FNR family transcriptional regulator
MSIKKLRNVNFVRQTAMSENLEMSYCTDCEVRLRSILDEVEDSNLVAMSEAKGRLVYKKGQVVFSDGTLPRGLFCMHSGKVKVYKTGEEGKNHIVRFGKPGDILGYRSLLSGEAYRATATALEESIICCIPKETFFRVLESDVAFSRGVMRLLASELRCAEEKALDLAQKPVRERLAEALLVLREMYGTEDGDNSAISITLSRDELASLVGTAIETLVRTLADLKREKLIATDKKKIRILDPGGLSRASNLHD